MTAQDGKLRGAVLGLGMVGRHHARLLQTVPFARLVGAVDPGGDRFAAVRDPRLVLDDVDALLAGEPPDFAVIAVPTEEHLNCARQLAPAGVHVLVEKPLASTAAEARELIDVCERAGIRAAVGHVERYNPALIGLRQRMEEVGTPFRITTERVGPFPDRVRDVGVVKDLATHDLDLVRWLGGAPIVSVAAQISHRTGREHEDLVLITGRLGSDVVFNSVVDWLTPAKRRIFRVVGDRGELQADTLTADLTLVRNGAVTSEWSAAQALKGVTEGDSTRFALARREPLLVELETFCAWVRGDDDAPVVTLHEGLETVGHAEAVLAAARSGETVRP